MGKERARPRPSFLSSGSEEKNHFFFFTLIKTVAFPTSTARLVTPLVPPLVGVGLSRPLSVSLGVIFRAAVREEEIAGKERATRNSLCESGERTYMERGNENICSTLRNFAADHCTTEMSFLSRINCGNCACAQKHVTLPLITGMSNKQPLNPQLFFLLWFSPPPLPRSFSALEQQRGTRSTTGHHTSVPSERRKTSPIFQATKTRETERHRETSRITNKL